MSKVVYVGSRAGLDKNDDKGGNASSPFDYELHCACEALLGPLGRFSANPEGFRTAYCPNCHHVTVIDKNAQIKAYRSFDILEAK